VFGLSWGQIAIIVIVGLFVIGPERIPTAVQWVTSSLRRVRGMAAGAQAELRTQLGPELEELRRQVADLQSLKELQELRELRDLHPKRLIGKSILGDEFSGGIGGFLGLDQSAAATNDASTGASGAGNGTRSGSTPAPKADLSKPAAAQTATSKEGARPAPASPRPATSSARSVVSLQPGERPPFDADAT
jgi:sec-independent protein translocase protein TatB